MPRVSLTEDRQSVITWVVEPGIDITLPYIYPPIRCDTSTAVHIIPNHAFVFFGRYTISYEILCHIVLHCDIVYRPLIISCWSYTEYIISCRITLWYIGHFCNIWPKCENIYFQVWYKVLLLDVGDVKSWRWRKLKSGTQAIQVIWSKLILLAETKWSAGSCTSTVVQYGTVYR